MKNKISRNLVFFKVNSKQLFGFFLNKGPWKLITF